MALFVRQTEERSKYQERIAAELQEKAKRRTSDEAVSNDIEDMEYLKDTKSTTSLAWVWVLIAVVAIALLIFFIIRSMN